ncbi:MAG TPA: DNA starvation/stationary phase protection protein Dps, partial [Candidatus Obscuribacterales bacterium]
MVKTAEKRVYKTKNDLPEATRIKVIDILNNRLADAFDLYSQAKQAHWNVKGPNFIALHELFDEVASSAAEWVDLIAERAVQLGGVAEGTA